VVNHPLATVGKHFERSKYFTTAAAFGFFYKLIQVCHNLVCSVNSYKYVINKLTIKGLSYIFVILNNSLFGMDFMNIGLGKNMEIA